LYNFSITCLNNKTIVLTGGNGHLYDNGGESVKTFAMDVTAGKWQNDSLPDLNIARRDHASLAGIDDRVYVGCG